MSSSRGVSSMWLMGLAACSSSLLVVEQAPEQPLAPPSSGAFHQAPSLHWERPLPGPPSSAATHTERSGPVVAGDSVFLGYATGPELVELHRGSGEVLRRFPAEAPVQSSAVVAEDRLWFADSAGYTWCYARSGGEPLWSHFGGAPVASSPRVAGGLVLVASVDDVIYALDAATGSLRWRYRRPPDPMRTSELTLFGAPAPVVTPEGEVLMGFSDGALVALGLQGGDVLWERRVGEGRYPDIIGTPLVVGRDAFVGGYSEPFVSFDLNSRSVRWRVDAGTAAQPLVVGDMLYHAATDGRLRAIARRTGVLAWAWDSETTGALTTPQAVDAGLLVTSSDGSIYLINPEDGQLIWEYDPGYMLDGIAVAPAVVGSQVLAVTNAGRLLSLVVPEGPDVRGAWRDGPRATLEAPGR